MPTFTPPTRNESSSDSFWGRYSIPVGQSVVKTNGVYTTTPYPWLGDIADLIEGVDWFQGGRTYTVDTATAAALNDDGYSVEWFTNSSFESGLTGWTIPGDSVCDVSTAETHGGSQSLSMTGQGTDRGAVSRLLSLTPFTNYEVSAWVKYPSPAQQIPSLAAFINGVQSSSQAAAISEWQLVTLPFNSGPFGSVDLLLYPSGLNAAPLTTYFDDIQLAVL